MSRQLTFEMSRQAQVLAEPNAASQRERVFAYISVNGPVTDEKIAEGLLMNPSTARPRRLELVRAGRIRPALQTQETKSGRNAVAWEVNPEGS
jgi:predicted ArsR family transcriptional regulator